MGPQGALSGLPSPRCCESELRLASADSGSVLRKLCLQGEGKVGQTCFGPLPGHSLAMLALTSGKAWDCRRFLCH